jgi:DNA-binding GntR family transcriptional regulator
MAMTELVNKALPDPGAPNYIDVITSDNYEFHHTVAQASGNLRLVRVVKDVLLEGERLYRLVIADMQPSDDHRHILEALVAGQGDRAANLARDHVAEVRDRTMETYLSSQAVLEAEIVLPASAGSSSPLGF